MAGHRFVGGNVELAAVLGQTILDRQWCGGGGGGVYRQVSFLGGSNRKNMVKYLQNREEDVELFSQSSLGR